MSNQAHNVQIAVVDHPGVRIPHIAPGGGKVIEKWTNYSITSDLLKPADNFSMEIKNPTREVFDLLPPDTAVRVIVDSSIILSGFVDERHLPTNDDGTTLYISGRDKGGRLVDESAPLASYKGLDIKQLAERLVKPWFSKVIFSNDLNRDAMLGLNARLKQALAQHSSSKGHRARIRHTKSSKPVYPNLDYDGTAHVTRKKVVPGEKRWQVLRSFLEELGLIGWSSADGESFFIGQPDYDQVPVFTFVRARQNTPPGKTPWAVKSCSLKDSVSERYSKIAAVGMGAGDFNVNVAGAAVDNPADTDFGIGKDFKHQKLLMVVDDKLRTRDAANVRAKREMAERDADGRVVEITVRGHGQDGLLFAPDSMCFYQDEFLDLGLEMLITHVQFKHSESAGEETDLHLVPKGTFLRI